MLTPALPGCGSPPTAGRVTDLSGSTTVRVLFEGSAGDRIEIRGPRFRSTRRESVGGSGREWVTSSSRATLTPAQLAEVVEWIEDEALALTSPDGRTHLSMIGSPPENTLRVERGLDELGIGWDPNDVWADPQMQAKVEAALISLRALARSFER